jgi:hypothetical protein
MEATMTKADQRWVDHRFKQLRRGNMSRGQAIDQAMHEWFEQTHGGHSARSLHAHGHGRALFVCAAVAALGVFLLGSQNH